jgi:hypothetical protein
MLTCAPKPCASCPYRKDAPSGLWHRDEYDKLPAYDGEMGEQAIAGAIGVFKCHQKDGRLCAGWVAGHGPHNLLAMRFHAREIDPAVWNYKTDVAVFKSGSAAWRHGMKDMHRPKAKAKRLMRKLVEKGKAK